MAARPRASEEAGANRAAIRRISRVALLSALALVLSYLETMIPLPVTLPGVKLGLGNIAVVVALFTLDARSALAVAVVKVLASGLLFGSPMMLAYSLGGTALAFLGMYLLTRVPGAGAVLVSMVAAILHNLGQLCVAALVLSSPSVFLTFPALAVAALVTGAITGAVATGVLASVRPSREERPVVDASALSIEPGEHVAFVGANGSGKTSCALQIAGLSLEGGEGAWAWEGTAGVAFQDPDDQIVASIVRDDVAFALENRGEPRAQMEETVASALEEAGASELLLRPVESLSGGQKQRVAVAGLLAMGPGLVVFDESTSMLDAPGREAFERTVERLCAEGVAVVVITQVMDEAFLADRIAVFSEGAVAFVGTPDELLSREGLLEGAGLELPHVAALSRKLREAGVDVPLTNDGEKLEEALCRSIAAK